MDNSNSNNSRNNQNEFLGVNKFGNNIRKISGTNYNNIPNNIANIGANYNKNGARQKPQAQVYNISKNNFRNIVQQLTASPRARPLTNPPPKHPNMRLQRFRPPPLSPINRPIMPHVGATQVSVVAPESHFSNSNSNNVGRPPSQFGWPSPKGMLPQQFGHGQANWTTPALSPISAYVQQLQSCIGEEGPRPGQQPMQPQITGQIAGQPGLQQQLHGYIPAQSPFQPNVPPLPSPVTNGPALLPSPTSQFLLPSPGGFFNLSSPTLRSPYPLLSPGSQFPPPLSPNFAFSPSGFFAPGSHPPPLSPGISFPLSPSGFFPISSPRWRDQ